MASLEKDPGHSSTMDFGRCRKLHRKVHKAIMRDSGQQVAVKLQHEGVEPMMLLDLDALKPLGEQFFKMEGTFKNYSKVYRDVSE